MGLWPQCYRTCLVTQVTLQGGETVSADETYIRESILNSTAKIVDGYQPNMPTFQGQVTEDALLQLIAYIKSLSKGEAGAQSATAAAPAMGTSEAQAAPTEGPRVSPNRTCSSASGTINQLRPNANHEHAVPGDPPAAATEDRASRQRNPSPAVGDQH